MIGSQYQAIIEPSFTLYCLQNIMMRFLYTAGICLILPFILIRLYWKGRKNPAYCKRIKERFMWGVKKQSKPVDIWVHAVSMGEVVAAKMLVEHCLKANKRVLVTTMTPTGSSQVLRLFGDKVLHQYIPYDYPSVVRRFFKLYSPQKGIIMETELWPNLLALGRKMGVSLFIANGRISNKAFPAYQKARWFFKPLLAVFTGIFVQSKKDAERFVALGANPEKVNVLGNMKSDLHVPSDVAAPFHALKLAWGESRVVVIAASTHDGEEKALFEVFKKLQSSIPGVILLVAPRHPERFESVYALAKTYNFHVNKRSESETISPETEILVLDCLGELLGLYGLSDYAFVGGSLVSIGGHNVLEPIALRVPVVCGQYMQNAQSLCDELLEAQAIQQVESAKSVVEVIANLHQTPQLKEKQVGQATKVLKAAQGSVNRHLKEMAI